MKQIYKGKLKLRIKKEYPYYGTGYRHLEKVLFYKWGWSVSLWSVHEDSVLGEFSDYAKKKILSIWPDATFENDHACGSQYIRTPNWIFEKKYDLVATDSPFVLYDRKSKKYIGHTHRGSCSFGIGDMLFTGEIEDCSAYYKNPKYRWKFIKTLLKYHLKGDWISFEDILEDNCIGHGIKVIIPFKEKGSKKIETKEEAYQAAINFVNYMS